MNLNELKKEIAYKWRVQESREHGANCVAYIDARQVMDILDEVVGPDNWQSKYESHNNNLYCSIGIKVGNSNEWVWKTDCGAESNIEKEKGEASDALKRAAVQWGIGRFLYSLPIVRLKTKAHNNKFYPIDKDGNILWSKEDLTAYINGMKQPAPTPQPPKPTPAPAPAPQPLKPSAATVQKPASAEQVTMAKDLWEKMKMKDAGKLVKLVEKHRLSPERRIENLGNIDANLLIVDLQQLLK